jgi:hypothetical protein|tara:strand:+ start:3150 stop:3566 length:417 start_codon:yes stop_codon:yes gene_type:complete
MKTKNKPSSAFWMISVIALIWNIIGVIMYLIQAFTTDDMKALLPETEREMYDNKPAWATAAFAFAVFAGLFGSIGLLMRKKWTTALFLISLIGILIHQVYIFFVSGIMEGASASIMVMPILVTVIGVFLVLYSKTLKT